MQTILERTVEEDRESEEEAATNVQKDVKFRRGRKREENDYIRGKGNYLARGNTLIFI